VPRRPRVLSLSAHTDVALREIADRLAERLGSEGGPDLDDVCTTLRRQEPRDHRLALPALNAYRVCEDLRAFARGEIVPGASTRAGPISAPRVAFVFCGMGSHWWGMGRELLDVSPAFREVVDRCDAIMRPRVEWSLLEELTRPETASRLARFDIA